MKRKKAVRNGEINWRSLEYRVKQIYKWSSIQVKGITRSEGKETNGATLRDFYKCSHADLTVFNFIFPGFD